MQTPWPQTLSRVLALWIVVTVGSACAARTPVEPPDATPDNALLQPWTGPYGGVPPFDRMVLDDLEPAFAVAMEDHLANLEAIATNPEPPTFDNVIVPYELANRLMRRVYPFYGVWRSNLSTPEVREVAGRLEPRLAEHRSRVYDNRALFDRIRAVYESPALASRSAAEQRLVELLHQEFVSHGAGLDDEARERFAAIQKRLSVLYTTFSDNVLHDEEAYVLYLDGTQLGGLPESFLAGAAAAAAERGHEGEWAVLNTRSSMDPFLTFSTERGLREQVWRTYYDRGDNGDAWDNNAIIQEILTLRHERSRRLGFESFADWRLQDRMAKTPERALALMNEVWPAARARVRAEVADMQAIADAEGAGITIEPWDYRFYAEKVRRQRFDLDSEAIKPYLQLEKLRDAMFFVAGELFGFTFTPVADHAVPTFHPDMSVFEVAREDGSLVGLWYLDPFARIGKSSGAWATTYRRHHTLDGTPVVLASNNSNFIRGAPGEPVLISLDDATTLFHEFGHALHALSSTVDYPSLGGGVRDFVEFQSQILERWLLSDRVIDGYLRHVETGEPMPDALVEKILAARTFNQGFATTEYLASALVDMRYHTADPTGLDPDAFERRTLAELGMPDELVMRHRSPHFGHVFSGEGYAAGYYGYLWARVLGFDAIEALEASPGGLYDEELGARLVETLFEPQNSVDPAEAYRAFRGRDPDVGALLRARGLR